MGVGLTWSSSSLGQYSNLQRQVNEGTPYISYPPARTHSLIGLFMYLYNKTSKHILYYYAAYFKKYAKKGMSLVNVL